MRNLPEPYTAAIVDNVLYGLWDAWDGRWVDTDFGADFELLLARIEAEFSHDQQRELYVARVVNPPGNPLDHPMYRVNFEGVRQEVRVDLEKGEMTGRAIERKGERG